MKKILRVLIRITVPIAIIVVATLAARRMLADRVQPPRRPFVPDIPTVDARPAERQSFTITVRTQGLVRALEHSQISSEVAGRVVWISPEALEGAFIAPGTPLLRLDDRDYRQALILAESEVAAARARSQEEILRAEQAAKDWARMSNEAPASPFTLREPQREAAEAALAAAAARLELARINLQRTEVVIPYPARIVQRMAGLGQMAAPGTPLFAIYRTDVVEIPLPLSSDQRSHLHLPLSQQDLADPPPAHVEIQWDGGVRTGLITRVSARIDEASQQLFAIAEIKNPFVTLGGGAVLQPGQFVRATIKGKPLENVWVIPRIALREDSSILLIDRDSRLLRHPVTLMYEDGESVITSDDLPEGAQICLSPVPYAVNGAKVSVAGAPSDENGRPAGP